jgi:hypothetical protein
MTSIDIYGRTTAGIPKSGEINHPHFDSLLSSKLDKAGGAVNGNIDMKGHSIVGLPLRLAENESSAISVRAYQDGIRTKLSVEDGELNLNSNRLINLQNPTADHHATNKKYVDESSVNVLRFSHRISVSTWTRLVTISGNEGSTLNCFCAIKNANGADCVTFDFIITRSPPNLVNIITMPSVGSGETPYIAVNYNEIWAKSHYDVGDGNNMFSLDIFCKKHESLRISPDGIRTNNSPFGILNFLKNGLYVNSNLCNVLDPLHDLDAANKAYVDTKGRESLKVTGGYMTGSINMNNNKITMLADPRIESDCANKRYVDSCRKRCDIGYFPIMYRNSDVSGFTSSASTENSLAFRAFGNQPVEWRPAADTTMNYWIKIECPEDTIVYKLRLRGRNIKSWKFEGSIDNQNFHTIFDGSTELLDSTNPIKTFSCETNQIFYSTYRLFCIEGQTNAGLSYFQIYVHTT